MAKNPSSRGIGTGSAQVYDMSRIDRSMNNFFNTISQKKANYQKDTAKAEAEKTKALEELHGQWEDYDYTNMMTTDIPAFQKMVEDDKKEFSGQWGKILNGDPYWANLYNKKTGNQKRFLANSVSSKPQYKKLMADMKEPDSGYSPERIDEIENLYLEGGIHYDQLVKEGITAPDTIIGNPLERIDDAFKDSGDELYTIKKTSYPNKKGQIIESDIKVWKDDSDAFPTFKTTVGANPRLLNDMNLKYPEMELEDQYKAFYKEYKQSRETEKRDVDVSRIPEPKAGKDGGISGKFNFAVKTTKGRGTRGVKDVLTVAKSSGSALAPVAINGKTGVVSEIIRHKSGKIEVVRSITKEDITGSITLTGETIVEPYDATMASHLESAYGIVDVDDFINKEKGQTTGGDDDPLGLFK